MFPGLYCEKQKDGKMANFGQKPWTRLDLPKNNQREKWPFLTKNHGLIPLENFDFIGLF